MPQEECEHGPRPKAYLAAPFFNKTQLDFVVELERVIIHANYELFSPRLGVAAVEMNGILANNSEPSWELREEVFKANVENIDDADLLVAVTDDFDPGVLFEFGYAYCAHVPIVSITQVGYGCNLMLAQSVIAHVKTLQQLGNILELGDPVLIPGSPIFEYAEFIACVSEKFKSKTALKEGWATEDQNA